MLWACVSPKEWMRSPWRSHILGKAAFPRGFDLPNRVNNVLTRFVAMSGCTTVIGRLDSAASDLDGNPATLETIGTLRGGIQADFEFRDFSPVPSGVLSAV
jgi:hypothetical protein